MLHVVCGYERVFRGSTKHRGSMLSLRMFMKVFIFPGYSSKGHFRGESVYRIKSFYELFMSEAIERAGGAFYYNVLSM